MFNDNIEKLCEAVARLALADYISAYKNRNIGAMEKIEKDFINCKLISGIIADPAEFFTIFKKQLAKDPKAMKIKNMKGAGTDAI